MLGVLLLAACMHAAGDEAKAAADKFAKTFPNFKITTFEASPIHGIYAVRTDSKIVYYAPQDDVLIFGELWSSAGVPLTQQALSQPASSGAKLLEPRHEGLRLPELAPGAAEPKREPARVGLAVGTGSEHFTAYIQPDCGACIEAHRWLDSLDLSRVTEHVVFLRMERGTLPYAKALQVVCAPPEKRREALHELFSPGSARKLAACDTGDSILASHARIAEDNGIAASPVFAVKGQMVYGFRRELLRKLLF